MRTAGRGLLLIALSLAEIGAGAGRCLATPVGQLEVATRCMVSGWAFDPEEPNRSVPVQIRFWSDGQLVGTLSGIADRPPSHLAGLLSPAQASAPHGFLFLGFTAPAGARVFAECRVQMGATGGWISAALSLLPDATEPIFSASLDQDPDVILDASTLDVTCTAVVAEIVPKGTTTPACSYRIEVWGQAGLQTASSVNGPIAGQKTDSFSHRLTLTFNLADQPAIDDPSFQTKSFLVTVWAVVSATNPEQDRLVGAAEVLPN